MRLFDDPKKDKVEDPPVEKCKHCDECFYRHTGRPCCACGRRK